MSMFWALLCIKWTTTWGAGPFCHLIFIKRSAFSSHQVIKLICTGSFINVKCNHQAETHLQPHIFTKYEIMSFERKREILPLLTPFLQHCGCFINGSGWNVQHIVILLTARWHNWQMYWIRFEGWFDYQCVGEWCITLIDTYMLEVI